ncbi:Dehydrogenase (flavoprotein) [Nitrosospira briensis]|uniref:Dehydrogenase (Flavoprotein) n=2 Tax=Nitrosospira briensis TaxID=35799 RepID=A0A1I4Z644_9PROT|nr:Dehydrogenase (flavoprotein) [Nitrosospira briensis]
MASLRVAAGMTIPISEEPDRDVMVVGGGPAGAMCALMLARGGARVSLAHWSGYAPGGIELVSGHARSIIERHCSSFFREAVPGVEVHETISVWDTPEPVTFNAMFNPWGPGVAVERQPFDRALCDLARAAGVSIVSDAKVTGIERRGDRWRILMRLAKTSADEAGSSGVCSASFLVIATGRVAAPFLERSPLVESSQIALMTLLQERSDKPCAAPAHAPQHALYIEATDKGWWYALPAMGGKYFAGFCIDRDELKRRQVPLKDFFFQELQRTRLLAPRLPSTQGMQPISGRTAGAGAFISAAGDGWLAVGDAAYAPDPLSGMGIKWAIETAELGARTLLEEMQRATQSPTHRNSSTGFAGYEDAIRARASQQDKTAAYHYGRFQKWKHK